MLTVAVVLTIITIGFLVLTCWAFTTDLTEVKFLGVLFLVAFSSISTVAYTEAVHIKDINNQQKMAVMMGATPLSTEEVYNTSQADLDKLLKIGNVYFFVETTK